MRCVVYYTYTFSFLKGSLSKWMKTSVKLLTKRKFEAKHFCIITCYKTDSLSSLWNSFLLAVCLTPGGMTSFGSSIVCTHRLVFSWVQEFFKWNTLFRLCYGICMCCGAWQCLTFLCAPLSMQCQVPSWQALLGGILTSIWYAVALKSSFLFGKGFGWPQALCVPSSPSQHVALKVCRDDKQFESIVLRDGALHPSDAT